MPAEPERDIEKTLKAYAERRRQQAGAPLEMHPATRRMLQAEAARQRTSPAERRSSLPEWALWLRRRTTLVCAFGTMVVALALIVIPGLTRARHERTAFASRRLEGASPEQAASPPSIAELAKAKPSDQILSNKKDISNRDAAAVVPDAPAVASLNQPGNTSTTEKRKESVAPGTTTTRGGANAISDGSSLPGPGAIAQSPIAASPAVAGTLEGARPVPPQATSLASAAVAERENIAGAAYARPRVTPAYGGPPAEASQQGTGDRFQAFKNDGVANLRTDVLALKSLPAQAPPAPYAVSAATVSTPAGASVAASSFAPDNSASRGAVTQRFYRLSATALKATNAKVPGSSAVLDSFRVEQSGGAMRVIDGDGSTYFGFVQPSDQALQQFDDLGAPALQAAQTSQTTDNTLTVTNSAPPRSFYFRVTGTNRTLGQPVVFSGTLTPGPAQATGVHTGSQARAVGSVAAPAAAGALPLSRSQLRGRAVVGRTNAIEVRAAPSGP